jgi:arabinosyltransferase C
MGATLLPYLFVMAIAPPGSTFSGFMWNPDDQCVYLSWMEQARQGHFFLRNLFTNDEQRGISVHLFFWLLGRIGALTHLPGPTIYHAARILFGITTLMLAYRLHAFFTPDLGTRRLGFWMVSLSAGLGWLPFFWDYKGHGPVDVWQPEAITFASIYTNGLFCISLTLMLGIVILLLQAEVMGQARYALGAGITCFLLANIHGYDVITLAAVWGTYLLVKGIATRRVPWRDLGMAGIAAAVAFPAAAYQYYVFSVDPVFSKRVEVATTSPGFWRYLLGYGLLLPLAAMGAWKGRAGVGFLIVWSVVGFAVPYLPVSFQRKMVMGLHFPLALLAAEGAMALVSRFAAGKLDTKPDGTKTPARRISMQSAILFLLVAFTSGSNVRYVIRDVEKAVQNQASTGIHPVFWPDREYAAMRWMAANTPDRSVVLASTAIGSVIPAIAGRTVYAGHWGETPRFAEKFQEIYAFYRLDWPPAQRERFLRQRGITHVYVGSWEQNIRRVTDARLPAPPGPLDLSREPYLTRIYPAPGAPDPDGVVIYALK